MKHTDIALPILDSGMMAHVIACDGFFGAYVLHVR